MKARRKCLTTAAQPVLKPCARDSNPNTPPSNDEGGDGGDTNNTAHLTGYCYYVHFTDEETEVQRGN